MNYLCQIDACILTSWLTIYKITSKCTRTSTSKISIMTRGFIQQTFHCNRSKGKVSWLKKLSVFWKCDKHTAEGCVLNPIAQCSRVTWSFSCQFWPSEAPVDSKCALICILQFLVAESLAGMKNYFCCLPFKHQRVLLKDTRSTQGLCAAHHAWGLYNIHILWPLLVCHKYQTNHVK